jgi:methylated-DNA-[protein]-cysteine S-methyltransferase
MKIVYTKKVERTWFGVALDGERVYATTFGPTEKEVVQNLKSSVPQDFPFQQVKSPSKFADHLIAVLKNVYDGKGFSETLSFETANLSNYAKRVIEAVCLIPAGYVASYGGVAKAVGGSPRAVGHVMASNPFAPLCPCHRVVRSDFTLGGYGGGLNVKLDFLKRERRGYSSKKVIEAGRGKLELFPAEFAVNMGRGKR